MFSGCKFLLFKCPGSSCGYGEHFGRHNLGVLGSGPFVGGVGFRVLG